MPDMTSTTIPDLRNTALTMFRAAIQAADPAPALRRHLRTDPLPPLTGGCYIVIAVGKAAGAMMAEALAHLPPETERVALAVTNYENARDIPGCTVMAAGHPVPDEAGEAAGQAVIALLDGAGPKDRVIALISGGGSALLPAPVEGVSLDDKAQVSRILLGAGFDITQMNAVRQHLSRLKGGGLARLAAPAPVRAYILSDVIGDDLRVIASGPTAAPILDRAAVHAALAETGTLDQMPASVQRVLGAADVPLGANPAVNTLIASNRQSLDAALAAASLPARIVSDHLTGDVGDAAQAILKAAGETPRPCALIFGGETTVTLTGTGTGGRNQELALRVALAADVPGPWAFLSGGTDGRDGPTDAAGGLVDPGTAHRIGPKAGAWLANNDSNAALAAGGDLLVTGATGTNVADVQIFLRG
jgi:glycerate 2-kinase